MVVPVCFTYNTNPISDILIGVLYHILSDMLYFSILFCNDMVFTMCPVWCFFNVASISVLLGVYFLFSVTVVACVRVNQFYKLSPIRDNFSSVIIISLIIYQLVSLLLILSTTPLLVFF